MRALKQDHFPGFGGLGTKEFGGSRLRGHAREQRPIAIKRSMHLVLKSSLAVGERSFLRRGRGRTRDREDDDRRADRRGGKLARRASHLDHTQAGGHCRLRRTGNWKGFDPRSLGRPKQIAVASR